MRAIVFDLDDTLYLERDYALSGFKAVATWAESHLGLPIEVSYGDLAGLFEVGVRNKTFDAWLAARGQPMDTLPALVRVFREHDPLIEPLPAAKQLLRWLRSHYSLGLVTDGYSSVQKKKLTALDLEDCFDAVVFSDVEGRKAWKPSPRPFVVALEALGVSGREAVYVADNPAKDFLGARRAGMWSIRVRTPRGVYRDLEPESPDHDSDVEIDQLENLIDAIAAVDGLILAGVTS
ncbi:MAG: HAD family hydrolase [Actinomycetota bacterium]